MLRDPIGLALAALGAGAAAGGAVITAGLIILRTASGPGSPDPDAAHLVIPTSLFGGIVVAAACGWFLARPIVDVFYRGLTTALGVFGALLLAGLAAPADMLAQQAGLAIYLGVLAAAGVYAGRKARRAGVA